MTNKEMRQFRLSARIAARRAVREGTITRLQRGQFVRKLMDDETAEEMADVCLAQAVECKVFTQAQAAGDDVDWAGALKDIDWAKLAQFIMPFILMFI